MTEDMEVMSIGSQEVETIDSDFLHVRIKRAENMAAMQEKMKELSLRATHSGDWVDQDGKPYCQGSGAEKIRMRWNLMVFDVRFEKYNEVDDAGPYYRFECHGKVGYDRERFMDSIGNCSSRDKFFAKRGGKLLPMQDVDMNNIQKSAYTNFLVNGIMRFLGLRNLTWEELKPYGILKDKAAKVEYAKGKKSAVWTDEQKSLATRITNYLLADADGNKETAMNSLASLTEFKGKDGKMVPGKRNSKDLSGKQIEILWKNIKDKVLEYEGAGKKETTNGTAKTGADQQQGN
jgi:hypothetical protein